MRTLGAAPGRGSSLMLLLTIAYIALIAGWMLWNGIVATPDYLLLLVAPVALLAGRWRAWCTDWVPFVALLLLWEGMRSLAYRFAATGVHWGDLHPELAVFRGQYLNTNGYPAAQGFSGTTMYHQDGSIMGAIAGG